MSAQLEAQLLSAFRWLSEERQTRMVMELALEALAAKDAMAATASPAPARSLRTGPDCGLTADQLLEGTSRSGQLLIGAHGPVIILVKLMAQHSLETYYHIKVGHSGQIGAEVRYVGHKDDLVTAGCIGAETLARVSYGDLNRDDENGAVMSVCSKAGPGKRGRLAVEYITADRAFAESLPGVRDLFPGGLPHTGPPDRDGLAAWWLRRPRLVVDNTRVRP
jgi:hypothetical protein